MLSKLCTACNAHSLIFKRNVTSFVVVALEAWAGIAINSQGLDENS
jgi:hypothetical protein